jgi:hypothetical protein
MSESNEALSVVEQRDVSFYDDELTAVRVEDGDVYVALAQMCGALGIDSQAQTRRIRRQPVLEEGLQRVAISTTHRGVQEAYVLRVDLVPLWLTGISTRALDEEKRPKLERFQREAARVLWQAFQSGRLTADPTFDDLLERDTAAVRAYKTALAVVQIAEQQVLLEAQLQDHERRLEQIEATLGDPGRQITPEQASQISQAVKAIAMALGKKTGRNEYGGVYGELYRRFEITSYKQLPAQRFQAALEFLTEWYQEVTGASPPF